MCYQNFADRIGLIRSLVLISHVIETNFALQCQEKQLRTFKRQKMLFLKSPTITDHFKVHMKEFLFAH